MSKIKTRIIFVIATMLLSFLVAYFAPEIYYFIYVTEKSAIIFFQGNVAIGTSVTFLLLFVTLLVIYVYRNKNKPDSEKEYFYPGFLIPIYIVYMALSVSMWQYMAAAEGFIFSSPSDRVYTKSGKLILDQPIGYHTLTVCKQKKDGVVFFVHTRFKCDNSNASINGRSVKKFTDEVTGDIKCEMSADVLIFDSEGIYSNARTVDCTFPYDTDSQIEVENFLHVLERDLDCFIIYHSEIIH